MTVTAQFDGRVFVPDGSVDLPVGRRVRLMFDPDEGAVPPLVGLLADLQPEWGI